jgi:type III pantothenate kinase
MNLIIDIGNTSTKFALFDNGLKQSVIRADAYDSHTVDRIIDPLFFNKAIVSSVKELPEFIIDKLTEKTSLVHILTHRSKLPFGMEYETPDTLGTDRIAGIAGAFSLFSSQPVLVIDAGTAITYDFLVDGKYLGGNISPGMQTRFRALHEFTGKLPLIAASGDFSNPGRNTRDAILAGVISGIIFEINEYIRTFEKKIGGLKIILTGGDGEFLDGKIDCQLTFMPDIVLDGLNYILEYNAV